MVPPIKEHHGRRSRRWCDGTQALVEDRGRPYDYEFALAQDTFQGQLVAFLRSIVQPARSFGAFCQTIAAEDYRGKRIRFSAVLKANDVTGGWGGLWLRVDGPAWMRRWRSTPWRTAP